MNSAGSHSFPVVRASWREEATAAHKRSNCWVITRSGNAMRIMTGSQDAPAAAHFALHQWATCSSGAKTPRADTVFCDSKLPEIGGAPVLEYSSRCGLRRHTSVRPQKSRRAFASAMLYRITVSSCEASDLNLASTITNCSPLAGSNIHVSAADDLLSYDASGLLT